ncbi:MAG: O-antigen ligase family protein [Lentisphaerales bacterium]|nr:O-antigen ligase family protein [Lentisphaerales bacterium]
MKAANSKINLLARYYIFFSCALLFLSLPLALFIPFGQGYNIYDFSIPSVLFLSFSGLALLLTSGQFSKSPIFKLSAAFILLAIISGIINLSPTSFYIHTAGFVIIPIALSFSLKLQSDRFSSNFLPLAISILWLINLLHAYFPEGSINTMGLSGNKNWFSALVLASLPFALYYLQKIFAKKMGNLKAWCTSAIITVGFSILPVQAADSRASFVAIILLVIYIPFLKSSKKGRLIICITTIIAGLVLAFTFKEILAWENTRNVRVSVWQSTLNMIMQEPILGVGPGNFEAEFPIYENRTHKEMLVAAHTTRHPHNELLYVASESGVPGGIIWLLLVCIALFKKPSTPLEWCTSICLFILLIQGMMDKPIFQYPTMLLFYLLIGQIWYREKSLKWQNIANFSRPKLLQFTATVIALFGLILTYRETAASFYNRASLRASNKGNYQQAYDYTMKSIELADWHIMPYYKAFIFAVKNLQDPQLAKVPDEFLSMTAPHFRNYQLVRGDYLIQQARQNPSQSQQLLSEAKQAFNNACSHHSSDILSYIERLDFSIMYRPIEEVISAQEEVLGLYHRKFLRYLNYSRTKDHTIFTQNWLSQKTYGDRLKKTNYLMRFMKFFELTSIALLQDKRDFIPTFSGPFNIGDMFFASEAYAMAKEFNYSSSPQTVYNELKAKINIHEGNDFIWPKELVKNKKGSSLSALCLYAMLSRFQGLESAIFKHDNKWHCLLYNEKDLWLLNDGKVQSTTALDIKKHFPSIQAEYFAYPQAYFLKNEFFSKLMAEDPSLPHYSTNPAYAIRLWQNHFKSQSHLLKPMDAPFKELRKRLHNQ